MAISNYTELQTAIASWIDRTDLTARIPEFIALAEAKINRELRIQDMEASADITIDSEFESLPTGFRAANSFYLDATPRKDLRYISPHRLNASDLASQDQRRPEFFTYSGGQLQFRPIPDASYTGKLIYFKAFDPLSTTPTNDLLTKHPDVYLYGALAEAGPFLMDNEFISIYVALFNKIIGEIQAEDRDSRTSGSVLQPVASGSTP